VVNELRQLLKQTGVSPKGLSEISGYNHAQVKQWACGVRMPPDALVKQMRQYAKYADRVFKKGDN